MLAHAEAAIISVHNTLPVSTSFKTTLGSCTGIGACAPCCAPPFFEPKGIMRCVFRAAGVFASNGQRDDLLRRGGRLGGGGGWGGKEEDKGLGSFVCKVAGLDLRRGYEAPFPERPAATRANFLARGRGTSRSTHRHPHSLLSCKRTHTLSLSPTHTRTYTHIHTHTYIHAHTYTHIHAHTAGINFVSHEEIAASDAAHAGA